MIFAAPASCLSFDAGEWDSFTFVCFCSLNRFPRTFISWLEKIGARCWVTGKCSMFLCMRTGFSLIHLFLDQGKPNDIYLSPTCNVIFPSSSFWLYNPYCEKVGISLYRSVQTHCPGCKLLIVILWVGKVANHRFPT